MRRWDQGSRQKRGSDSHRLRTVAYRLGREALGVLSGCAAGKGLHTHFPGRRHVSRERWPEKHSRYIPRNGWDCFNTASPQNQETLRAAVLVLQYNHEGCNGSFHSDGQSYQADRVIRSMYRHEKGTLLRKRWSYCCERRGSRRSCPRRGAQEEQSPASLLWRGGGPFLSSVFYTPER